MLMVSSYFKELVTLVSVFAAMVLLNVQLSAFRDELHQKEQ